MDRRKHWKLLFWIYCAGMLTLLFWRTPNWGPAPYRERVLEMVTLLGTCDIDDLILNLLGAAMGYGLFLILRKNEGSAAD